MKVLFGTTTKRKNSTFIPTVDGDLGDCLLKSPTSVVSPSFEVYTESWPDYNYCYVPDWHRYYFITDLVSEYTGTWTISCSVDVLATYKTGIMNTTAFVERAESIYNPAIPDDAIAVSDKFETTEYENIELGVVDVTNGTYIFTVAGLGSETDSGFSTTFAMSKSEFVTLRNMFYTDSTLTKLMEFVQNPLQCVVNCIWVPLQKELVSQGSGEIFFGNVGSGIFCSHVKKEYFSPQELTITCPYFTENPITHIRSYLDYRNCTPYTETFLLLPGVGMVELDTRQLLGNGKNEIKIRVDVNICPITGDITYLIYDYNNGADLMFVEGNFAVQLPVATALANPLGEKNAQMSMLTGGANILAGGLLAATGHATMGLGMMMGGVSAISQGSVAAARARQHVTTIKGTVGGWAARYINEGIKIIQRKYELSGSASAIGRPYRNTARLGNFSGYVKCAGAYVGVPATDYEHNALISLINGGFYVE